MKAVFVLSPEASGNLLAKAVSELPEVKNAMTNNYIIIGNGTTNAYIVRILTGDNIDVKNYAAGIIENHKLDVISFDKRYKPVVLHIGRKVDIDYISLLPNLSRDDVLIKGGNAIDPDNNIGVLTGAGDGGTIGKIYGHCVTKGVNLILPVSMRKLIPSVKKASNVSGKGKINYSEGIKTGLFPVSYGKVLTEIDAVKTLYDLSATLISSGGFADSSGDLVLLVEGDKSNIDTLMNIMEVWKE